MNPSIGENSILNRDFEFCGKTISIIQDFSGELGGTVWDASLVLIKYLENSSEFPPHFWERKRVLELGSGTGIISIACSLQGATVVASDRTLLLELIRANIIRNRVERQMTAVNLDWGDEKGLSVLKPPFDVVIASDLIAQCYSESFDQLIETLDQASDKNTLILIAFELRDRRDVDFWKKLSSRFSYFKVSNSKLDPYWRSDDIGVFQVKKICKE